MEEKKTIYREYFPGYMGHIPMKNEVIGLTVGATNDFIKGYLTREVDTTQKLRPTMENDYNYYKKNYYTDQMAKNYPLEEDQVFSNQSKNATTWINSSKYSTYPQHIPNYKGHIQGVPASNLFGSSFAKTTAVSIKGNYNNKNDSPPEERYKTINNLYYQKPKTRSFEEEKLLNENSDIKNRMATITNMNIFSKNNSKISREFNGSAENWKNRTQFDEALNTNPKQIKELPYIVGYKGFRRGVNSGNYFGKNFTETSLKATNKILLQNN